MTIGSATVELVATITMMTTMMMMMAIGNAVELS
jgi:hypothetical protein